MQPSVSIIKVMLFDDNNTLRESLQEIINDSDQCEVVGSFPNGLQAIEEIEKSHPHVIIMDINMPEESGIITTKRIKETFPGIQIIMQTVFDDDENVFAAIAAGASGYILKNYSSESLIEAIQQVYEGGSSMSPSIARKVLSHLQNNKIENADYKLTLREREVLNYLVLGLPYKQIAVKMNITYDTVRSHMKKIYEKLHVSSMTEAVVIAVKHQLVQ